MFWTLKHLLVDCILINNSISLVNENLWREQNQNICHWKYKWPMTIHSKVPEWQYSKLKCLWNLNNFSEWETSVKKVLQRSVKTLPNLKWKIILLFILGKLTLHSHLFSSLLKGFGIYLNHNLEENILKVLTLINTSFSSSNKWILFILPSISLYSSLSVVRLHIPSGCFTKRIIYDNSTLQDNDIHWSFCTAKTILEYTELY